MKEVTKFVSTTAKGVMTRSKSKFKDDTSEEIIDNNVFLRSPELSAKQELYDVDLVNEPTDHVKEETDHVKEETVHVKEEQNLKIEPAPNFASGLSTPTHQTTSKSERKSICHMLSPKGCFAKPGTSSSDSSVAKTPNSDNESVESTFAGTGPEPIAKDNDGFTPVVAKRKKTRKVARAYETPSTPTIQKRSGNHSAPAKNAWTTPLQTKKDFHGAKSD